MTIIKMKNIFFLLFFFTIICNVDASTNDSLECINNAHEEIGGLDENENNDEKNILEESEEFDKNIIFNLNENKKQKYGVYFGFKTGLTITHSYNVSITSANSTENLPYKFSNVLNFDGFIGYSFFEKFHIPVRTEVEFSYNDKSVYDTLNWIKANTFSLNHYYDAYALSFDEDFSNYNVSFVPYVLLGLGITDAELSVINPIEKNAKKFFKFFI